MHLKQTACCCGRWLVFWLALSTVEGKDSSLFHTEEKKDISVELTKTDDVPMDNTEFPVGCSPRKLSKRSTSFDLSWPRAMETNCQIVPLTTTSLPITNPQTTREKMRKTTHPIETESSEERPPVLYFLPYYPRGQHTVSNVLFPSNRGTNGYHTIWYTKFLREDSSEEKIRKRDIMYLHSKKGARPP